MVIHLTRRHEGNLTAAELQENRAMSKVRESVEWAFANVLNLWKFVSYRYALQLLALPVEQVFGTAVLLTNMHTCLYGNEISEYYGLNPPNIRNYFG